MRTSVRARSPAVRRYEARKSRCASSAVTGDEDMLGAVVVTVLVVSSVMLPLPLAAAEEEDEEGEGEDDDVLLLVGVVL